MENNKKIEEERYYQLLDKLLKLETKGHVNIFLFSSKYDYKIEITLFSALIPDLRFFKKYNGEYEKVKFLPNRKIEFLRKQNIERINEKLEEQILLLG